MGVLQQSFEPRLRYGGDVLTLINRRFRATICYQLDEAFREAFRSTRRTDHWWSSVASCQYTLQYLMVTTVTWSIC